MLKSPQGPTPFRIALLVLSAALTVALLYVVPRFWPSTTLDGPIADGTWTARSRAWFVASGLYAPKVETGTGQQCSWTQKAFRIEIPRLDRSQPHRLMLAVSAGRSFSEPVDLRIFVDGVRSTTARVEKESRHIEIG